MKWCLTALLLMCPASVLAQPVFFDDFEGNALLPHWGVPPPSHWQYNVSNSMLNVTNLLYPSFPKSPTNFVTLGGQGAYASQTDFQLDARMGWGTSAGVARFELTVTVGLGLVATIGYREGESPPGIFAATGAGLVTIPSPPPGIYDFRISRIGAQCNFYFEGTLFASLHDPYGGPVDGIQFFFSSPYPGPSGPFYVDRVQVAPAPGTLLSGAALALLLASRRQRSLVTSRS